jgi:hypothetical protein
MKLMGYDFTIEYKKGLENSVANSVSRRDHSELKTISNPVPNWIEPIKEEIA